MSSYLTNSEADEYFESRPYSSEWDTINEDEKTKLLAQATRLMERLNYVGNKADVEQELEFPRGDDTEIPSAIKDACSEIAYAILSGRDIEKEHELLGAQGLSNEVGRLSFSVETINLARLHSIPSILAWNFIRPYLRDGSVITLSRVS